MTIPDKYQRQKLPTTRDEAIAMADARKSDLNGTARELELCADLLRIYAKTLVP